MRHAGFEPDSELGFPGTRIYPDRARGPETAEMRLRREQLNRSREYFEEALDLNLQDEKAQTNIVFWMGWIDYINGDFENALNEWESIDPRYSNSDPVLLIARGNAYFYTNQQRAALGYYLKVKEEFETEARRITIPDPTDEQQRYTMLTLSAVYNNIGAVYEREHAEMRSRRGPIQDLQELEKNALLHYYNAVDIARKMDQDNEIARTNIQLAFKYGASDEAHEPIIDDWVPPVLYSLREDI